MNLKSGKPGAMSKAEKEKYDAVNRFLEGEYVLVHVDPRQPGVDLPPFLMAGPSVTLKLSRLFRGAMAVEKENISAELLFSGRYFTCTFPFTALWGITNERGENLIWPDSTPQEVLGEIMAAETKAPQSKDAEAQPVPTKLPAKGHLKRVK